MVVQRFKRGQSSHARFDDLPLDELGHNQACYRLGGSHSLIDTRRRKYGWCEFHAGHIRKGYGNKPVVSVLACQDCRDGMAAVQERLWLDDEGNFQRRVQIVELTGRDPVLPDFSEKAVPEQLTFDVFSDEPS